MKANANFSDDFPKCPKCGRAVGQRYWLPPYDIILKQPKQVGDFTAGVHFRTIALLWDGSVRGLLLSHQGLRLLLLNGVEMWITPTVDGY